MLFTAGWTPSWALGDKMVPDNSWQGLVDPFCGSGTIAIEGTAMMLGLPPGRFRNCSPFQGTLLEDSKKWSSEVRKSLAAADINRQQLDNKLFSISASDRDSGSIEATKVNAKKAGVLKALIIQRAPLSGQTWFETPSKSPRSLLVVTNPPFGKRVSSKSTSSTEGLLPLYQSLGKYAECLAREHERRLRGVVLTGDPELWLRTGAHFPSKTSFKTFHGGIKVSAMNFDLGS
uniref:Ribosomal RNA large subunit methyltransferase K/L-like methyltransferase domain-containing protein n=1 Tax=Pseudo-nitzschia australis TaxID=44445 RepID=A0A7S4EEP9_9STRA